MRIKLIKKRKNDLGVNFLEAAEKFCLLIWALRGALGIQRTQTQP